MLRAGESSLYGFVGWFQPCDCSVNLQSLWAAQLLSPWKQPTLELEGAGDSFARWAFLCDSIVDFTDVFNAVKNQNSLVRILHVDTPS